MTTLPESKPNLVEVDGADLWVSGSGILTRVRASDGKFLETWTGLETGGGIVFAMGRVVVSAPSFVAGLTGRLVAVDPSQPAGAATTVATGLPQECYGLAYDGGQFWTANGDGTVSIVTPGATLPWTVTTTAGGYQRPTGLLYDGTNFWMTDETVSAGPGALLKLNAAGGVLQTITVGRSPEPPLFDGSNIWVPNQTSGTVSVVRASSGAVLATLTGNGITAPYAAAFDGQRVLVTSFPRTLTLWKAADLTPLGSVTLPSVWTPFTAASDGASF